jgi:hypothetical protein
MISAGRGLHCAITTIDFARNGRRGTLCEIIGVPMNVEPPIRDERKPIEELAMLRTAAAATLALAAALPAHAQGPLGSGRNRRRN